MPCVQQMNRKKLFNFIAAGMALLVMASCNKNDTDLPAITPDPANVAFINVIPDGLSLNMYFNGTRQTGNKIAYAESSGFISVPSEAQNVSFKDTTFTQIQAGQLSFTPGSNYTIFVTGRYYGNTNTVNTILLTNAEPTPTGKPKLRFVNAAADAPALDVYVNSLVFSNKAYGSVSDFALADSGTVAVKVNLAGSATTILNKNISLSPNSVYTLYSYGLLNQTGGKAFNVALNNQ